MAYDFDPMNFKVILLIFISVSCFVPGVSEERGWREERITKINKYLAEKKYKSAYTAIKKLKTKISRTQKTQELDAEVEALLAKVLKFQKNQKRAEAASLKALESFKKKLDAGDYEHAHFSAVLELSRKYVEAKKYKEAIELANKLLGEENGNPKEQVFAAELLGLAHMGKTEWNEALKSLNFAKHNIKAYLDLLKRNYTGNYKKDADKVKLPKDMIDLRKRLKANIAICRRELKKIAARIRKKQKVIDDAKFLKAVGEGFILYRRGENCRRAKKYKKAIAWFSEVIKKHPDTIYAEAAKLNGALALISDGNRKAAEKHLVAFVEEEPLYGLYKGQALLELGRMAIEYKTDPDEAMKWFVKLETFIANVRKNDPISAEIAEISKLPGMLPGAVPLVRPPQDKHSKPNFFGSVHLNSISSSQLLNRITAPWYLDDLECQCAKFLGFLYLVDKKKEKAIKCFSKLLGLENVPKAMIKGYNPTDYTRLMGAAKKGFLYAVPEDLKLYPKKKQRMMVMLGDFYYVTMNFKHARKIAKRLLKGEFGNLSRKQKDYPQFMFASATYWIDGREKAFPEYEKVYENKDNTYSEFRAKFAAGNVGVLSRNGEYQKKGMKLFQELVKSKKKDTIVYKAHISLAVCYYRLGDTAKAITTLKKAPKFNENWNSVMGHYIDQFVAFSQKKKEEEKEKKK